MLDNVVGEPRIDVQMAHLNWRGEPSLNPRLMDLIRSSAAGCRRLRAVAHQRHADYSCVRPQAVRDDSVHRLRLGRRRDSRESRSQQRRRNVRVSAASRRRCVARSGRHTVGVYSWSWVPQARRSAFLDLAVQADEWMRVLPVVGDGQRPGPSSTDDGYGALVPRASLSPVRAGPAVGRHASAVARMDPIGLLLSQPTGSRNLRQNRCGDRLPGEVLGPDRAKRSCVRPTARAKPEGDAAHDDEARCAQALR